MTQPTYAGQPLDVEAYREELTSHIECLTRQSLEVTGEWRSVHLEGKALGYRGALVLLDEMTPQPPVKHRPHVEAMLAEAARRLEAQGRS